MVIDSLKWKGPWSWKAFMERMNGMKGVRGHGRGSRSWKGVVGGVCDGRDSRKGFMIKEGVRG